MALQVAVLLLTSEKITPTVVLAEALQATMVLQMVVDPPMVTLLAVILLPSSMETEGVVEAETMVVEDIKL